MTTKKQKKQKKQYKVFLFASLPASAVMTVVANSEEDAIQYALDNHLDADWDGSDYSVPEKWQLEDAEVLDDND